MEELKTEFSLILILLFVITMVKKKRQCGLFNRSTINCLISVVVCNYI